MNPLHAITTTTTMLALLAPANAWACAVCFSAKEANRVAFIDTMILLTLVPLAVLGGGIYWLYRRAQSMGDLETE